MSDIGPFVGNGKIAVRPRRPAANTLAKTSIFKSRVFRKKPAIDCPVLVQKYDDVGVNDLSFDGSPSIANWLDFRDTLEIDNKQLRHRLENFVPLVLSVVKLTAECSKTVIDFRDALEGRLRAIANAAAATRKGLDHCALEELVRLELSPYCRSNQFDLIGPPLGLRGEVAQSISIIIHELTTNAVKHGALSCPTGRVLVRWAVQSPLGQRRSLRLEWLERGGPRVSRGVRRGFGTTILCDDGKAVTGGTSTLLLRPEGLEYVLVTDLDA